MAGRDPWALQRWALGVACEREMRPVDAHVLLILAVRADVESCECCPTVADIASAARRSPGLVTHALGRLVRAGLIERHRRGQGRPSMTRLLADDRLPVTRQTRSDLLPAAGQAGAMICHPQPVPPVTGSRSYVTRPLERPDTTPPTPRERGEQQRLGVRGSGLRAVAPADADVFAPPPVDHHGRPLGRKRAHDRWLAAVAEFAAELYPAVPDKHRVKAVTQALRSGAATREQVEDHVTRWYIEPARRRREAAS